MAQVVQERCAGAQAGTGRAQAAQHVGVDKIRGHLGKPEGTELGGHPLPVAPRLQHAAGTRGVELAHGATGIHTDFIRRDARADVFPAQPQAAQRIRSCIDRHLQAARVVARRVQLAGFKTPRQLARGFHLELARTRQQEFLFALNPHPHVRHRGTGDFPAEGNHIRQVFAFHGKTDRLAIAVGGQPLVPGNRRDVEVLVFNATHQRVIEHVLLAGLLIGKPHHRRQGSAGALLPSVRERGPYRAGISMMARRPARRVYAAKSHNYR